MPERVVKFKFDIGDKVCLVDYPDLRGRVGGMSYKEVGQQYYICWWDSGKRYDEWLFGWEIKEVN